MNPNEIVHNLRILYVAADTMLGGSTRSLHQLVVELKNKYNVQPTIIIPKVGSKSLKVKELFEKDGIPCYMFRFYWYKGKKGFRQYLKIIINWLFLYPKILFKLRSLDFDLVHTNSSVVDLGGVISRVKGVRHIWHLREFGDLDFGLYSGLGNRIDAQVYNMGDLFIAISHAIEEHFMRIIPKEKIRLVYNGVILKSSSLNAEHMNSVFRFVMVGAIKAAKNQLEALYAVRLLKERGYIFKLHFIGSEDREYRKILDRYIVKYDLDSYVIFEGECNDVPLRLSKMDVGLMLSKNEAFGRVTVEYMMQSLVVIASDSGANTEIIEDGKSGYIYHLGDIEALVNIMSFCIENRSQVLDIALTGKNIACALFSSTRNTQCIYDLYRELLS